jgi:amidase
MSTSLSEGGNGLSAPSSGPVDRWGAFCRHALRLYIPGHEHAPLSGLTFTVKDLIDVAGVPTGGGNPDWLKEQSPASSHAHAVAQLIDAGATLIGKTNTDELAFSLTGCNVHYGTPINPKAPDRIPGGSSSGSAAAVAGEIVDFAIGTDTGGSIRVPAAYCGIYGCRPSHGRISLDGVLKFSPSFDTVGWFARDAQLLRRVGLVLFGACNRRQSLDRILRADDVFARVDPRTRAVCDSLLERLGSRVGRVESVRVCPTSLTSLEEWNRVFRTLRSIEVWQNKGPWIQRAKPKFGPDIERNFLAAARTTEADAEHARPVRRAISAHLAALLGANGILVLPTTPGPAPSRDASDAELELIRDQTQALTCIAGLGELPQVNIPAGLVDGAPVGLSLIAAKGNDEQLLDLVARVM